MISTAKTTQSKAQQINQEGKLYGTFAEIGAGQEVARHFFLAGRASHTVAKSISAYDMTISDEIYGREMGGRYVCEPRLKKMLDHEYDLLIKRLDTTRGDKSRFFAFASTVATSSEVGKHCHGWIGIRFQTEAHGPYSEVQMHVRMLDRHRLQQQEVLGILGVNLIYAVEYARANMNEFLETLVSEIKERRLSIDLIRTIGPAFTHLNSRLLNLELVRRGLCEAVIFGPNETTLNCGDALFRKSVFVMRGAYRPVTINNIEIAEKGFKEFCNNHVNLKSDEAVKNTTLPQNPLALFEITMKDKTIELASNDDFLDRIDVITSLGYFVMVSQFELFFELKDFIRLYTQEHMGISVSAMFLDKLLSEKFYEGHPGGVLSALGHLVDDHTKIYVYPFKTAEICMTAKAIHLSGPIQHLYNYMLSKNYIIDLVQCDDAAMSVQSKDVRQLMKNNDPSWEKLVPPKVVELIKKKKLFCLKA